MERGELFGEMGLLDGLGRSAEARALEPSQVMEIPYAARCARSSSSSPTLLWGVVALLSGRLRSMDAALADSVFLDVTGRTAKRLLELAGDEDEFVLPVTQEELAGMVGASRERVNKAIASFVRLGWIDQSDRRYAILDREQLTRRVGSRVSPSWGTPGSQGHLSAPTWPSAGRQSPARKAIAWPRVGRVGGRWAGRESSWTKPWSAPS